MTLILFLQDNLDASAIDLNNISFLTQYTAFSKTYKINMLCNNRNPISKHAFIASLDWIYP
jgi:hypothetical protein